MTRRWNVPIGSNLPKHVAFEPENHGIVRLTEARGILPYCIQHGLDIGWRAGDNLQHLTGCSLLFQRLGEIVGALAQFLEQSRVLDGDDGLRGEVFDQFDLLVGEAAYLLPIYANSTNELIILQHRDPNQRPRPSQFDKGLAHLVLAL